MEVLDVDIRCSKKCDCWTSESDFMNPNKKCLDPWLVIIFQQKGKWYDFEICFKPEKNNKDIKEISFLFYVENDFLDEEEFKKKSGTMEYEKFTSKKNKLLIFEEISKNEKMIKKEIEKTNPNFDFYSLEKIKESLKI